MYHFVHLKEVMDGLSIINKVQDNGKVDSSLLNPKLTNLDALKYSSIPLQDYINQMTFTVPVAFAGSTKKWKKRARAAGQLSMNAVSMSVDRCPTIEMIDQLGGKKQYLEFCSSYDKENVRVVARAQHHRSL